jgi:hypothetical protein
VQPRAAARALSGGSAGGTRPPPCPRSRGPASRDARGSPAAPPAPVQAPAPVVAPPWTIGSLPTVVATPAGRSSPDGLERVESRAASRCAGRARAARWARAGRSAPRSASSGRAARVPGASGPRLPRRPVVVRLARQHRGRVGVRRPRGAARALRSQSAERSPIRTRSTSDEHGGSILASGEGRLGCRPVVSE